MHIADLAKKTIKGITPPVAWSAAKAIYRLISPAPEKGLFDGDGETFQQLARACQVYGEYGVGASTIWVASNTEAKIVSVDSSKHWIEQTSAKLPEGNRHRLLHVDLGELGDWGRPLTYARRSNFRAYVESLWKEGSSPDLVLIDGRFRISCLMHGLLNSLPGTVFVFDDYTERGRYHVVEEVLRPRDLAGRQAIFVNNGQFIRDAAARMRDDFIYVID